MPMLILQLALLIAIAFLIGAIIGRARRKKKQGLNTNSASAEEKLITSAALAEPKPDNAKIEDLAPPKINKPVSTVIDKTKNNASKDEAQEDKAATVVVSKAVVKVVPPAEPVGPAHNVKSDLVAEHNNGKAIDKKSAKSTPKSADVIAEPVIVKKTKPELLITPRNGKADDLTKIKGVGAAIQTKLNKAGIYHYDQLVDLNAEQQKWLGEQINFRGRVEREDWVNQSKKLLKSTQPKVAKKEKPASVSVTSDVKKATPARARKPKTAAVKSVVPAVVAAEETD